MNNKSVNKCGNGGKDCQCSTHIDALTVFYGNNKVLDKITFEFNCGELDAIIGPNGGGKSTLLKAILGQVEYNGTIRFCNGSGASGRPRIGYVPQNVTIQQDSPINVCDLMLMSEGYRPVWMHVPRKKRLEMANVLSLVAAEKLIDKKVGELSGGEMQRVLLACALNPIPDILLLDEPVSGVDVKGLEVFYEIVCSLRKKYHISIILVSHDIGAVAPHADTFILLNKGIIAKGKPVDVLQNKEFISLMGIIATDPLKDLSDTHCSGDTI